ncbi:hypothetical protein G6F43_012005 [Rhizopus delemar]|nr:hypothetical protein G6F43_012005 [Rhizopus delemar]
MSWANTSFAKALCLKYPIIQAPCAGHTGAELIAAVSNAGGLGSLGAGMMPATQLRETIRAIRQRTQKPFAVNLFCRPQVPITHEELQVQYETDNTLDKIRVQLNIVRPASYQLRSPPLEDQVRVILDEGVPVVSFTFGFLPDAISRQLWQAGVYLIGTATTQAEALALADGKANAILAQGLEAGGHRGSFLKADSQEDQLPIRELVREIRPAVSLPVIAAGGLSTDQDVADVMALGADGAALGTLFMFATESTTPKAHRNHMLTCKEIPRLTRGLTGRWVRSFPNELMKHMEAHDLIPPYDIHSSKTKDIATFAADKGLTDYMLLLSGQNTARAAVYSEQGTLSAADILKKIVTGMEKRGGETKV